MQPHELPHFFTLAEGLDDEDRLRLLLAALPAHAFARGATAAIAWGLPLPWHERTRAPRAADRRAAPP